MDLYENTTEIQNDDYSTPLFTKTRELENNESDWSSSVENS